MNKMQRFYPEAKFGGFTDIDGTVAFFGRVAALVNRDSVVLDVGCGRGAFADDPVALRKNLRILQGRAARVIGIDVDRGAKDNPFLDEFHLIESDGWPVDDDSIDLIVCDFVLEHIDDPPRFFSEIRRVLKDGGFLCIRTPNRWSYVALMACLIPNKYHSKVVSVAQDGRKAEDVFPTVFKCNTIGKLRGMMRRHGFDAVVYGYESEPSYLSFSTFAYFLGVLHQRLAPGFLKPALFAFGKIRKNPH